MDRNSERGNAIFMIFIAVALFGMLAYAFMQGSRVNLNWLTSEQQKTAAYSSQDCTNAINLALKRLEARACGSLVSYEADGSNLNVGAPTDGSCSVFHPNGGAIKPCNGLAITTDPCITGPIGAVCSDAAIYIGDVGGTRIYARAGDSGAMAFSTPGMASTPASATDGPGNTDTLMTLHGGGPNTYPAAAVCRTIGPEWYLPAKDELHLLWTNRVALNLASIGIVTAVVFYWSSTEVNATAESNERFADGLQSSILKAGTSRVRCVRR